MIKVKNIVIMVVVLILLVGAALAVMFLMQKPDDSHVDTDVQSIEIYKVEKSQIVQMDIAFFVEQFSFVRDGEQWAVKDRPEVKLRNSSVDLLAMEFASINGKQKITDAAEDLSVYGLDQPQGRYTIHLADGTQKQFSVGNDDPVSGAYYFAMDGDPAVYTIYSTKAASLLKMLKDYRDTTFLTVNTESLNRILIQNTGTTIELVLETTGEGENATSTWNMLRPLQKPLDTQRLSENIIGQISALSIQSFVDDGQDHGLSNPAATVTLSDADGASQTLTIGDESDAGSRYVRLNGDDNVYLVEKANLEFIHVDPFLLISKFLNLENIDNVSSIDITADGETHTMSIARDGDAVTYHVDGKEAMERNFKDLYQKVIGLSASGLIDTTPSGNAAVTVVYHLTDNSAKTLAFYEFDDRNYAAVKDGVCEFRILKKDVSAMLTALQSMLSGGKQD